MNRWFRLWSAFIGMVMIGNLQYAWTLFAEPMVKAHAAQGWSLSEVQWGFGLFIAAGTWAMPFFATYIDKIGPRFFMIASGLLSASPGLVWLLALWFARFRVPARAVRESYGD